MIGYEINRKQIHCMIKQPGFGIFPPEKWDVHTQTNKQISLFLNYSPNTNRHRHMNAYSSSINNDHTLETTQMSFSGSMNKLTTVHPHNGKLLSSKWINAWYVLHTTWMNFKGVILGERSQSQKVTYYIVTYIFSKQHMLWKTKKCPWRFGVIWGGETEQEEAWRVINLFCIFIMVVVPQTYKEMTKLHRFLYRHTNECV